MEQTTINALERIENPILIILLCVLLVAVIALWYQYTQAQKRLYELAVETVGALKDLNTRLGDLDDRLERIEAQSNA